MKELVHFTADWCNPCKRMAPIIEEFLKNNPDIHYDRVDVDVDFNKAEQNNVQSVPTFISKVNGKIYDRHSGIASKFKIESMFSGHLPKKSN
jgi:thioredoxin 1